MAPVNLAADIMAPSPLRPGPVMQGSHSNKAPFMHNSFVDPLNAEEAKIRSSTSIRFSDAPEGYQLHKIDNFSSASSTASSSYDWLPWLRCPKSTQSSVSVSSATFEKPENDLWQYQKELSRSMTFLPSRSTWVNAEICAQHDPSLQSPAAPPLQSSPPARTDLPTAFEWLLAGGGAHLPCLGMKVPLQPEVGASKLSFGRLSYQSRDVFHGRYLRLGNGLMKRLDEFCPPLEFNDVGYRFSELNPPPCGLQVDRSASAVRAGGEPLKMNMSFRFLGVAMKNAPAFVEIEYACQLTGVTIVPMYTTLGAEALCAILEETKMTTLVADSVTLKTLLDHFEANRSFLPKTIILTGAPQKSIIFNFYEGDTLIRRCHDLGLAVIHLNELMDDEPMALNDRYQWHPSDVWTLSYTSGTTNRPKGVMLSQQTLMNATHDVVCCFCRDPGLNGFDSDRCYFSYLPLAHVFERACVHSAILQGAKTAFHSGDLETLFPEIKDAGTTLLVAVPRVLERLRAKVLDAIVAKGPIIRALFHRGLTAKLSHHANSGSVQHGLVDALIMNKIKSEVVGPGLCSIVAGGAPMSASVRDEINCIFNVKVIVGYGLTESTGPIFVQHTSDIRTTIGWIMRSVECKVASVPELGHFAEDSRGELLVRGYALFSGYFRQVQMTADAFTDDGWFKTGDVAQIDIASGGASIIDRVKNCFKLSQGEYIAPEKIENILTDILEVDQLIVLGSSSETFCIGIVILSDGYVQSHGGKPPILAEVAIEKKRQREVAAKLELRGREASLFGFEIPKSYVFLSRAFVPTDGFHTPTMKVKRALLSKHLTPILDHLYAQGQGNHIALDIDDFMANMGDVRSAIR